MKPGIFFKDKSVLVVGLGVFGGGISTVNWIARFAKRVTVTDLKTKKELESSIKKLSKRKNIHLALGGHREEDFVEHDIIVVNPGVPKESRFLSIARDHGKVFENEASIFFRFTENPIIAVTGTRGKTTTTHYIAQLLGKKYGTFSPTGNNPQNPFLKEIYACQKTARPVVAELSSWQLELLPASAKGPHIAVVTNLYPDHLNRYKNIEEYADAKSLIYKDQISDDFLILNKDNSWTKFFLRKKPRATLFFISKKQLLKKENGMFLQGDILVFQYQGVKKEIVNIKRFREVYGEHSLENLANALLASLLCEPGLRVTEKDIETLKNPPFRQEIIFVDKQSTVINDSTATSPDAVVSSVQRFSKEKGSIFIVGGTDKNLEFEHLAQVIQKKLNPERLVFLSGSATQKLLDELKKKGFFKKRQPVLRDTLTECIDAAYDAPAIGRKYIVFSPGAASFEKFKNEFDRGEQFTKLIHKKRKMS